MNEWRALQYGLPEAAGRFDGGLGLRMMDRGSRIVGCGLWVGLAGVDSRGFPIREAMVYDGLSIRSSHQTSL